MRSPWPFSSSIHIPWRCIGWFIIVSFTIVIRRRSPKTIGMSGSSA